MRLDLLEIESFEVRRHRPNSCDWPYSILFGAERVLSMKDKVSNYLNESRSDMFIEFGIA